MQLRYVSICAVSWKCAPLSLSGNAPCDKAEKMAEKKKVIVGICAMEKKAKSKPMQAILSQMEQFYGEYLELRIFPENVILNEAVEAWPLCDCLVSFHAQGFPLDKAIAYSRLHPQVFVLNDLVRQYDLLDRVNVYKVLKRAGIEHPRYTVLRRDGPNRNGGGSQRLFRKVANRSSEYSSTSRIRSQGSYIYEEFMPTDGTDVKVYAVGPDYAHAEARKSPALDGKVERNRDGKEVRYPVILTSREKIIARKVVLAFKQTVCGFDLLRTQGKSYVCDVNGFSFVKTSRKYYEDTAKILGNNILRAVAWRLGIPWKRPYQPDDPPMAPTTVGKMMELRCVLGVIRHGDRTPKQKMKIEVNDPRFFDLFAKYAKGKGCTEVKLKRPKQLQEVLDLARALLLEALQNPTTLSSDGSPESGSPAESEGVAGRRFSESQDETARKWDQVRGVLEMYGHFAGINRKVQLKYMEAGMGKKSSDSEAASGRDTPRKSAHMPSLLLVLKWGGELTTAGRHQAECLGRLFRTLYPGIEGAEEDSQGLGFLRLHSTYRHDLKIYASDEGRVQMTAAAFTKGLLALEGELAPIVSQMVKSAHTNGLLDDDHDARKFQTEVKKFLHECLRQDQAFGPEELGQLNPLGSRALRLALQTVKNPREYCESIAARLATLVCLKYH